MLLSVRKHGDDSLQLESQKIGRCALLVTKNLFVLLVSKIALLVSK